MCVIGKEERGQGMEADGLNFQDGVCILSRHAHNRDVKAEKDRETIGRWSDELSRSAAAHSFAKRGKKFNSKSRACPSDKTGGEPCQLPTAARHISTERRVMRSAHRNSLCTSKVRFKGSFLLVAGFALFLRAEVAGMHSRGSDGEEISLRQTEPFAFFSSPPLHQRLFTPFKTAIEAKISARFVDPRAVRAVLFVCTDGADIRPLPFDLCECSDDVCTLSQTVTSVSTNSTPGLSRLPIAEFQNQFANFSGFNVIVARTKLRLGFYGLNANGQIEFTSPPALSDLFDVDSGEVEELRLFDNPGTIGECPYCRKQAFSSSNALSVQAGIYDRFGNVVGYCSDQEVLLGAPCRICENRAEGLTVTLKQNERNVPGATKTSVFQNGMTEISDFIVSEAGSGYSLEYKTNALCTQSQTKSTAQFSIFTLDPAVQESDVGGTTGDEVARLIPQPGFNFGPEAAEKELFARICYDGIRADGTLVTAPPQEGLCKCSECVHPATLEEALMVTKFLSGNLTAAVDASGMALYQSLTTELARPDLRLLFYPLSATNITSLPMRSAIFAVTPGRLNRLALLQDPADTAGCRRCPVGVYLAGSPITAEVALFDIFDNVVGFCGENAFCLAFDNAPVASRLFREQLDVTPTAGQQSTVPAVDGTANFTNIIVTQSNSEYYFVFRAEEQTWPGPLPTGVIEVHSKTLTVVSSAPSAIQAVGSGNIISADSEVFPEAPQIEILDQFGNRVISDCSEDPDCLLPTTSCTPCDINSNTAGQGSSISVSLVTVGILGAATLSGTTTASTMQGVATFTDLALSFIPESLAACGCDNAGVCGGCLSCYPDGPQQYTLQFSLPGLGVASRQVALQNRVQKMNIVVQDTIQGVAGEKFLIPMQVEVLDCTSPVPQRVTSTSASVRVSLALGNSGGALTGTVEVPINQGLVVFDDLSIDLPGSYVVEFEYLGNVPVNTVPSNAFSIEQPVTSFAFLSSPEETTTVAGFPFAVQPQIQLIDASGVTAVLSSLAVSASIESDPGGQQPHNPVRTQLLGTTIVQAAEGKAQFFDLRIEKASVEQSVSTNGFTLRFSQGAISILTNYFDVVPAPWTGLFIPALNQPQLSTAGQKLTVQPWVYLVDTFNNRVRTSQVPAGTRVDAWLLLGGEFAVSGNTFVGNPPRLLRAGCDERCFGVRPTICYTCTSFSKDASAAFVQYDDLRVDIGGSNYSLHFNSSGFEVTSDVFTVINTDASTLSVSEVDEVIQADRVLRKQPIALLVDKFNNPVTVEAAGTVPQLSVRLHTLSGREPTLPPFPPVPGQALGSICERFTPLLRGQTLVNMSLGLGVFTDLMIIHAMRGYKLEVSYQAQSLIMNVNSTAIDVVAGAPAGLCTLSLPGRCSANSPCLDPSEAACRDVFGNVQKTCHLCRAGDSDCDPTSIPTQYYQRCRPGEICVELRNGPDGATITSSPAKMYGTPLVPFAVIGSGQFGGALFDELIISASSPGASLRFFSFLTDPDNSESAVEFEYVSQAFNITPAGPFIEIAQFSRTVNQLAIRFDKQTNMNAVPGVQSDQTCARELDPIFRASLGTPHYCSWPSPAVLLVSFGEGAYINTTTRVMLLDTAMITFSAVFDLNGRPIRMTSLPATTQTGIVVNGVPTAEVFPVLPDPVPSPDVQLTGLLSIGGCERINIDGSGSSGHVGRPFEDTQWSLDFSQSYLTQGIMSAGSERGFTNRDIDFSNMLADDLNVVSVKIRPNAPIFPQSTVAISGLPGMGFRRSGCPAIQEVAALNTTCLNPSTDNRTATCLAAELRGPCAEKFEGSRGEWNGTTLTLRVQGREAIPASQDCEFQFELYNPSEPMLSLELGLEVLCPRCKCVDEILCAEQTHFNFPPTTLRINCATECLDQAVFGATAYPIGVVSASIAESNTVISAYNRITVTIVSDSIMSARSKIVIKDMKGLPTPSGPICLGGPSAEKFSCMQMGDDGPCSEAPAIAHWEEQEGSLTMTVRSGTRIEANERIVLQFELENANEIQREECIARTRMECNSVIKPTVLLLSPDPDPLEVEKPGFPFSGDVLGSGLEPAFEGAVTIDEGNTFQGVSNLVLLGLASTVSLPEKTILHLVWSDEPGFSEGPVRVHGARSACFVWEGETEVGHYDPAERRMRVQVGQGCEIQAKERLEIAFQTVNPSVGQDERTVSVSISFEGCGDCQRSCTCRAQGKAAFTIVEREAVGSVLSSSTAPAFENVLVSENVRVPQQANTLTITAKSSASMVGGVSTITISGLLGTATPDSIQFPVQVQAGAELHSVMGSFQSSQGALEFLLPATTEQFTARFTIQNGDWPGSSDGVFVSSDAQIDICGDRIRDFCDAGGYNSTRVISRSVPSKKADGSVLQFNEFRKFVNASISELTRVTGAFNIITVRLKTNFEIPAGPGTQIEVNGILNTNWPLSTDKIFARESMQDLFPNCACHACEESCCTQEDLEAISGSVFLWTYNGSGVMPFGDPSNSLIGARQTSGSWDSEAGKLTLNVLPGRPIPVDTDLVFGISVLNPAVASFAVRPEVTIVSDSFTLGPQVLTGSVMAGDRGGFVTRFTVEQDNNVLSNFNRLSFTFQVNYPLFSLTNIPVRILITDLFGYNLAEGFVPIDGPAAQNVAKTGYGNFTITTESSQMELKNGVVMGNCLSLDDYAGCALHEDGLFDFTAMADHRFSFVVKNTDVRNSFRVFPKAIVRSAEASTPLFFTTSAPLTAANPRPVFLQTRLDQSTDVRKATSTLSLSFQSNVAMYQQSTITLRGLDNSGSPSGLLELFGAHADLFTCTFSQPLGEIELLVNPDVVIEEGTEVEISFRLINPDQAQSPRDFQINALISGPPVRAGCQSELRIERYGLDILIEDTPVTNNNVFHAGDSLTFEVATMHESTTVSSAVNTITLTLVSKVDLRSGSKIILTNLDSPVKSNPALKITGSGSSRIGGTGSWTYANNIGRLEVITTEVIEQGEAVVLTFKLRNKECYRDQGFDCLGTAVTVDVDGLRMGSEQPAQLTFETDLADGAVFGAGSYLSWIVKSVSQGSSVNSAPNRLVFSLRPNAPLYGGSRIQMRGLFGSATQRCRVCLDNPPYYDRVPQLGCSNECLECAPEVLASGTGRQTFTPCLPLFTTDGTQHPTFVMNSEFVADDGMSATRPGGVLTMTIADGQKMSELEDTDVVVILENSPEERYRDECSPVPKPTDELVFPPGRDLLKVLAIQTSICSEQTSTITQHETCDLLEAPDGLPTGRAKRVGRRIPQNNRPNTPIDWYGRELADEHSTCIRQADVVAVQEAVATQTELVLDDLRVDTPSLRGLPTLVEGGLQFGVYTIRLYLENWVGGGSTGSIQIAKETPPAGKGRGPLGNENAKPAVSIRGLATRFPFSDQALVFDAVGELALCLVGAERESLSYRWDLVCTGFCDPPLDLNDAVQSPLVSTLQLPGNFLRAGNEYSLVCTASQFFLSSTAAVAVRVVFRAPYAVITGIGQGGQVPFGNTIFLDASDSFDPDVSATGLTAADFRYEWSCQEEVVALRNGTEVRRYEACDIYPFPSGLKASFNSTTQKVNTNYRIGVNVTRAAPPEGLVVSDGWYNMGSAVSSFELVAGAPVQVSISLCDQAQLGTPELCNAPLLRNRISGRDSVVLKATAYPTSSGIVTSYVWSAETGSELQESMVLTVLNDPVLILKPDIFVAGHVIRLRCTARDSNANDGFTVATFRVNVPPLGGALTVSPPNGTALHTEFDILAEFWLTDPENLPLTYRFFYVAVDGLAYDMPLARTQNQAISSVLPQGAMNASYHLDVGVEVMDILNDYTRVLNQVPVFPLEQEAEAVQKSVSEVINGPIDRFLRLGHYGAAQATVAVVSGSLSQAISVCGAEQVEADACKLRQSSRTQLFLQLQHVTSRVQSTAAQLEDQGRVLMSVTNVPEEVDFALIRAILDYVDWSLEQARSVGSRGPVIADVYASVVDQVMAATQVTIGQLLRRSELRGLIGDEDDMWTRSQQGAWTRQAVPVGTARSEQQQLLNSLSALSTVSLQASVAGQTPIVITKPSFTMNSTRLSSVRFEGFTAKVDGQPTQVVLPAALFSNLEGDAPETFEVMLALFDFESNPLPGAVGPHLAFEIREFGSNVPLIFETDRQFPIAMTVPYEDAAVTREKLPATGQEKVPFLKVFDFEQWAWVADNLEFQEDAFDFVVMQLRQTASHFAVGEVLESCDGIPLGEHVLDQCGVCGGDDGTCSGCDGIPGTGRFKNCSGHGACEGDTCKCEAGYYDIMCATLCSEPTTCSGHGVCDFATGKSCFCNTGWGQGADVTYPGPFCTTLSTTGGVGVGSTGDDGKLSDDDIQWLLMYIVPAVAGGLLLCLALCWYGTRRNRQLKSLHRTIIEFPQPQLEIPAEQRPDAIIATPDDNGWTNIKLPDASADFGYGPNSGQLASAIAASTRTSIGKMSVQRIDRRTKLMKEQINSKWTVDKYSGPKLFANGNGHQELRESDEEEDVENGETVAMYQINDLPEWSNGKP